MQGQGGYMAASVLILIIGIIVILSFVIEIGRLLHASAQAENGVDMAAKAGVYKYGKVLQDKTKEEYSIAFAEATIEVQELEANGLVLTPEDEKQMIKDKTKTKMTAKASGIKSQARSACAAKLQEIISLNKLIYISGACTDSEASVTAKSQYNPVMPDLHLNNSEMTRSSTEQIIIQTL